MTNNHKSNIMAFQAQFPSPFLVVLTLFLFFSKQTTNARALNSSTANPVPAGKQNQPAVNALQKHVMFFDRNHDGIIYPTETYEGFRAIGCGVALSTTAAVVINQGLSSKTRPGESFNAKFPIVVKNIQMAKHTSDSGVYDKDGGFVESKFDEIFAKHAKTNPNSLTSNELNEFLKSNKQPNDQQGWMAGLLEWKILYKLGKDDKGLLQKETVRAVYDGSLFEQLAKKKATKT